MEWDGKPGQRKQSPSARASRTSPNAAGFDYFYGFTHARNIGTIIEQDRVVENVAEVDNQPRMIAKAVEWIGSARPASRFSSTSRCARRTRRSSRPRSSSAKAARRMR
jgi:arylsulfatase A